MSAAGLTGIGLTTKIITICPSSISGGIPVYKLPFIPKSLPGHVIGRTGMVVCSGLFIGGVCSGYIDLSTTHTPVVIESLIK